MLLIGLGGTVEIWCHFFIAEQLELGISLKEITGPSEHEEVLSFVEDLAEASKLSVDITPKNLEITPFLTCASHSRTWHTHNHK